MAEAGLDSEAISACPISEYPIEASRPAYSVLGSERLEMSGVPRPPHWRNSLPDVVDEIKTWI